MLESILSLLFFCSAGLRAESAPASTDVLARFGISSPEFVGHWDQYLNARQERDLRRPVYVTDAARWKYDSRVPVVSYLAPDRFDELMLLKHVAVALRLAGGDAESKHYDAIVTRLAEGTLYFLATLRTPTEWKLGGHGGLTLPQTINVVGLILPHMLTHDSDLTTAVWRDVRSKFQSLAFLNGVRATAARAQRKGRLRRAIGVPGLSLIPYVGRVMRAYSRDRHPPHATVIELLGHHNCAWMLARTTDPVTGETGSPAGYRPAETPPTP
jgi:hypothetical protein